MIGSSANAKVNMESLYKFYYRPLCLYALHYLDDVMAAEDVVQECFIKFWEKVQTGEVGNPKHYLYMMVKNSCFDQLRKKAGDHVALELADKHVDDAQLVEDSFMEARLWTAIDSLPDRCRRIFLMAKRDGKSYEDISAELGISANTVRNQVSKALGILRKGSKKIIMQIFSFFG